MTRSVITIAVGMVPFLVVVTSSLPDIYTTCMYPGLKKSLSMTEGYHEFGSDEIIIFFANTAYSLISFLSDSSQPSTNTFLQPIISIPIIAAMYSYHTVKSTFSFSTNFNVLTDEFSTMLADMKSFYHNIIHRNK